MSRLANREMPPGVRVADFGIRGFDLTYALIDGADVTILVDACSRGGASGGPVRGSTRFKFACRGSGPANGGRPCDESDECDSRGAGHERNLKNEKFCCSDASRSHWDLTKARWD